MRAKLFGLFVLFYISWGISAVPFNELAIANYKSGTIPYADGSSPLLSFRGIDCASVKDIKSYSEGTLALRFRPDINSLTPEKAVILFETANSDSTNLTSIDGTWGIVLLYMSGSFKFGFHSDKYKSYSYDITDLKVDYDGWTDIVVTWGDGKIVIYTKNNANQTINYDKSIIINPTDRVLLGSGTSYNSFYSGFIKDVVYENRVFSDVEARDYIRNTFKKDDLKQVDLYDLAKNGYGRAEDLSIKDDSIRYNGKTSYNFIKNIFKGTNVFSIDMDIMLNSNQDMHIVQSTNDYPGINSGWGYTLNYNQMTGLSFHLNTMEGIVSVPIGKVIKLNQFYNIKIVVDMYEVAVYVNNKLVKKKDYYKEFHDNASFIMVGSGVFSDYFADMVIKRLVISNTPFILDVESSEHKIEKVSPFSLNEKINIDNEKIQNIFLSSAISMYVLSGISFTLAPVFFALQNYNSYYYNELYSLYDSSKNREETDIYYKQMKSFSDASNAFLIGGVTTISLSVVSFTTGIIFNILYNNCLISNKTEFGIGFDPGKSNFEVSLRVRL